MTNNPHREESPVSAETIPSGNFTLAERAALTALYECEEYLDRRSDVIDGDYGQPQPNREMTLLGDVRLAIAAMERGKC